MTTGSLVKVTHIGPGPLGNDPCGPVLETVGKVGIVYGRTDDNRVLVLFPGGWRFAYSVKELERVQA